MKYLTAILLLLSSLLCEAQQRHVYKFRTIVGTVVDKSNQPVSDCTLLFAETGVGSTTDAKGSFKLHFPDESVMLTLYYRVDKHKYYIKVNPNQNTLNIKLDKATFDLSERNIQDWNKNKSVYEESVSQAVQSEEFYEYVHHGEHRKNEDVVIDEPVNGAQQPIDTARIYESITKIPIFGSNYNDWFKYLKANLKYPDKAKQDNVQGKVIITFVVERDGRLTNIKVARSVSPECDKEAIRLLQTSPKWHPAMLYNTVVRCKYMTQVVFEM